MLFTYKFEACLSIGRNGNQVVQTEAEVTPCENFKFINLKKAVIGLVNEMLCTVMRKKAF